MYSTDHFSQSTSLTSSSSTAYASMPPLHTMPQAHMPPCGPSRQSISMSNGPRIGVGSSTADAMFGQYPIMDKPFTNQLAHQNTFTPHGFSYESPFAYASAQAYAFEQPYAPTIPMPQQQLYQDSTPPVPKTMFPTGPPIPPSLDRCKEDESIASGGPLGLVEEAAVGQKEASTKLDPKFPYPATNIATGPRFSELLEAKLGLAGSQASIPNPPPQSVPLASTCNSETSSTLGSHARFTPPTFSLPMPAQNACMGMSSSQIESNLLDSSQTVIPPDYVAAPFPAEFYPWAMQNRRQALAISASTTAGHPLTGPQFVLPREQPIFVDPLGSMPQASPALSASTSAMGCAYLSSPSISLPNPAQSPVTTHATVLTPMQMNVSLADHSPPLLQPSAMAYSASLPIPQPVEATAMSPMTQRPTSWNGAPIVQNTLHSSTTGSSMPTSHPPVRDTKKPKFTLRAPISASSRMSALVPTPFVVSASDMVSSVAPVSSSTRTTSASSIGMIVPADTAEIMSPLTSSSLDWNTKPGPVASPPRQASTAPAPALSTNKSSASVTSPRAISPRPNSMAPSISPGMSHSSCSTTPSVVSGTTSSHDAETKKRKRSSTTTGPVAISPKLTHHRAESLDSSNSKANTSPGSKDHQEEVEKKIIIACHRCRSKKLRCDGVKPRCHQCARHDLNVCAYDEVLKRRGPGKNNKKKDQTKSARKAQGVGVSSEEVDKLE